MAAPIIHKLHDPAGTSRLRKRAINDSKARVKKAGNESIRLIVNLLEQYQTGTIQVNEVQRSEELKQVFIVNRTKYLYEVDANLMANVNTTLRDIVYRWLLGGQQGLWSAQWYMNTYLNSAWQSGAGDSLQSLQNLSSTALVGQEMSVAVRALDLVSVLSQPAYQRPIQLLSSRVFNDMLGLSDAMVKDMQRILSTSIADGISARDAAKRLRERLWPNDKGYLYRAERIARTEINGAYAQSYLEFNESMGRDVYADSPFKPMIMHLSALTATTRPHHAARHGKVYTADEQAMWWAEGANRILCLCSITSVLVNRKTGEVLQQNLYKKAREQGEQYFAVRGKASG